MPAVSVWWCRSGFVLAATGLVLAGCSGETSPTQPLVPAIHFAQVSAGNVHSCAVTTAGVAYCWGNNIHGQLGDATLTRRMSPVRVLGGLAFAAVSAGGGTTGGGHSCGVTTGGVAYCWGYNSAGQLGDGTFGNRSSPALVLGGLSLAQVSAGGLHRCGVATDAAAY